MYYMHNVKQPTVDQYCPAKFLVCCGYLHTLEPLILATLNFGVWVNVIILDPVILAFLLPTTLKRYCIQIFAARYFRELARLAKFAK